MNSSRGKNSRALQKGSRSYFYTFLLQCQSVLHSLTLASPLCSAVPAFASTAPSPGLFSTNPAFAPAASSGAFGFSSSPGLFGTPQGLPGAGTYTMPGMGALVPAAAQGPAPSVGQMPYGSFPVLPAVSEPKVGISARPIRSVAGGGNQTANIRGSPLLSIRSASATPKFGVQVRAAVHCDIPPTASERNCAAL